MTIKDPYETQKTHRLAERARLKRLRSDPNRMRRLEAKAALYAARLAFEGMDADRARRRAALTYEVQA